MKDVAEPSILPKQKSRFRSRIPWVPPGGSRERGKQIIGLTACFMLMKKSLKVKHYGVRIEGAKLNATQHPSDISPSFLILELVRSPAPN